MKISEVRFDENGLIPAVVQDAASKEVLTLAYMNEVSLKTTLETGETWFYSRSRDELWHKGATSGNTQKVVDILFDCDQDSLVVKVIPEGPACHTGSYSCFTERLEQGHLEAQEVEGKGKVQIQQIENQKKVEGPESEGKASSGREVGGQGLLGRRDRFGILAELEQVIASREAERPEGAYTTYLFDKGVDKILKKVGEEAGEVIIAAKNRDHEELTWEVADLFYHVLVLLREQKLPLDHIMQRLEERHKN